MKKLIILIFLCFSLCSCKSANSIYYNTYIASVGFEKKEDNTYTGYFFLPTSIDVGNTKGEAKEEPTEIAIVDGKNVADVFNNFFLSSTLIMNLKHISSMVLHESILNPQDIENIISFVKKYEGFDLNFYIFSTKDNLADVFKNKNPNNESVILTMLCEPLSNEFIYTIAKPIHFLNFCRDYYNQKVLYLPLLESQKIWNEEKDSNYCRGVTFYSKEQAYCFGYDYEDFEFISSKKHFEYNDNNLSVLFENYKFKINYKESISIDIQTKANILYTNISDEYKYLEDLIYQKVNMLIDEYQQQIDFLNLEYNNSLDKTIDLSVKVKKS